MEKNEFTEKKKRFLKTEEDAKKIPTVKQLYLNRRVPYYKSNGGSSRSGKK